MALQKKARRVSMTLADESGYSFNIETMETFESQPPLGTEPTQVMSRGWVAKVELLCSNGMKTSEDTLPVLLDEARHFVRMLEEALAPKPN